MKILIPVDGSEQANAALDFVASRSTLIGQAPDVHLLNVQPTLSVRVTRAIGREEAKAYQRAQADEVLRPAVARLKHASSPRCPRRKAWPTARDPPLSQLAMTMRWRRRLPKSWQEP